MLDRIIGHRRDFLKSAALTWTGAELASVRRSAAETLPEVHLPDLRGSTGWLNSDRLDSKSLRGKVVLINFWTYSCINSLRELPYMKAWAAKYKDAGLVVIGVHTPEFGFEKERGNVERAVHDLNVAYPVALDSNYAVWQAFHNQYWPANYFADAKGRIRYHHFGEGEYETAERVIQALLKENGASDLDESTERITADGPEKPPSDDVRSPETYVGYARTENFASPERMARDSRRTYSPPAGLALNHWGLGGVWNVSGENGSLESLPGKLVFRFHSRDLHIVLSPARNDKPIRFRVSLDGIAPGNDHGTDSDANGAGEVREPRMYQLIRQKSLVQDRTFEIEFLDPGVQAFSFTFG